MTESQKDLLTFRVFPPKILDKPRPLHKRSQTDDYFYISLNKPFDYFRKRNYMVPDFHSYILHVIGADNQGLLGASNPIQNSIEGFQIFE